MGYAKVIHKKEERKKSIKKMNKCPRYLKQWVLRCLSKKKKREEMNKIAHVFLQKFFMFQTRETYFKGHSRIRLATICISTHMHILIYEYDFFFLDRCFDFTIYTTQVCFHMHSYLSST
jgi:hypothetical protein